MSAEVQENLTKVDSASGDGSNPTKRRASSIAPGVLKIEEILDDKVDMKLAPETQKLGWKINTSPTTCEDPDALKKMLTTPPLNKIELVTQLGVSMTAKNNKGVTVKDALDVIYKQFRKKADDEIDLPYLKGFEWDKEDETKRKSFIIHFSSTPTTSGGGGGGGKKKSKKGADDA